MALWRRPDPAFRIKRDVSYSSACSSRPSSSRSFNVLLDVVVEDGINGGLAAPVAADAVPGDHKRTNPAGSRPFLLWSCRDWKGKNSWLVLVKIPDGTCQDDSLKSFLVGLSCCWEMSELMFLTHDIGPPSDRSHNPQLMTYPSKGPASRQTCDGEKGRKNVM